jgi:hypothetical protein
MWLAKPVYELLPYYYIGLGGAAIGAAVFVDVWYWPQLCTALGFAGIIAGLAVLLKRRDYRSSRSRLDFDKID